MTDISDRFGAMFLEARKASGLSQLAAAKAMGVSKTTIQHWEDGTSSPSQKQGFAYFQKLGIQPLPYYLHVIYHAEFGAIQPGDDDAVIDAALSKMLHDLTPDMKRKLLFAAYGDHGSSPASVLEMVCAHLHTPLVSRIGVAELIKGNYDLACGLDRLAAKDYIMPDEELLKTAIDRAKEAVKNRGQNYTAIQ